MHCLNIDPAHAEEALVELARHVPPHVTFGRPLVVSPNRDGDGVAVVTDTAVWIVDAGSACRVEDVGRGRVEAVIWRHGVEEVRAFDQFR